MQNQSYPGYLYRMLMEHESVFVPEVGFFKLVFKDASFQQFMTVLNPPATQLQYDSTANQISTFADLLVLDGMDTNLATAIQSTLITDFNTAKHSGNKFEIPYFGSFENGSISVTDQETFNKYRGLNVLSVSPLPVGINNIRHEESFSSDIRGQVNRVKPSVTEQYLLPLLSILTVLFFIAYWLWHKESETVKVVPENQQIVTQIDSLPASDTIHDKDINQETLGAKADIPSDTKGIESTANLKVVEKTPEILTKVAEKSVVPKKEISQNTVPSTVLKGSECVIITGSFKSLSNADKLKKSLMKNGYSVYTEYFGGFHRVGIIFDCQQHNRDSFKMEIRQKINTGAWILGE